MLPAIAGQAEGDLGGRRPAQDAVGAGVRRRRMADHGEALLARLERLGLLVPAMGAAPPPLLMHIGAVGRVHQAHHGVVDMAVEIHPFDQLRVAANHAGKYRRLVVGLRTDCGDRRPSRRTPAPGSRPRDRTAPGCGPPRRPGPERARGWPRTRRRAGSASRDRGTPPSRLRRRASDQLSGRQGRGPVGADVAHGVDLARPGAADQHRLAQQLVALEIRGFHISRQGREVPGVGDEALAEGGGRGLGFRLRGRSG